MLQNWSGKFEFWPFDNQIGYKKTKILSELLFTFLKWGFGVKVKWMDLLLRKWSEALRPCRWDPPSLSQSLCNFPIYPTSPSLSAPTPPHPSRSPPSPCCSNILEWTWRSWLGRGCRWGWAWRPGFAKSTKCRRGMVGCRPGLADHSSQIAWSKTVAFRRVRSTCTCLRSARRFQWILCLALQLRVGPWPRRLFLGTPPKPQQWQ